MVVMGDGAKAGAAVVCCMLLLGQCKDATTGAKVAAGGAAIAGGAAAGSAAGAAAGGAIKGLGQRAQDRASGRNKPRPTPNGPSRPLPPPVTTSTFPVLEFDGIEVRP